MRRHHLLLTFLVIVIAALASQYSPRPAPRDERPAEAPQGPDYYIENFTAITLDAQGQAQQRLQGTRLEHYSEQGQSTLNAPHLTLYRDGQPDWLMQAGTGSSESHGEHIYLHQGVQVERATEQQQPLQLTTESLHIEPARLYAETDAPLQISAPNQSLSAVGMQLHGDQQQLTLTSEVEASYAPSP